MDLMKDIDELAKDFVPAEEPVEETAQPMTMLRGMQVIKKEDDADDKKETSDSIMSVMIDARNKYDWK